MKLIATLTTLCALLLGTTGTAQALSAPYSSKALDSLHFMILKTSVDRSFVFEKRHGR